MIGLFYLFLAMEWDNPICYFHIRTVLIDYYSLVGADVAKRVIKIVILYVGGFLCVRFVVVKSVLL